MSEFNCKEQSKNITIEVNSTISSEMLLHTDVVYCETPFTDLSMCNILLLFIIFYFSLFPCNLKYKSILNGRYKYREIHGSFY